MTQFGFTTLICPDLKGPIPYNSDSGQLAHRSSGICWEKIVSVELGVLRYCRYNTSTNTNTITSADTDTNTDTSASTSANCTGGAYATTTRSCHMREYHTACLQYLCMQTCIFLHCYINH